MAAKPIERFVRRQIQEQGGWAGILGRIASGESIADVSRTLWRPDSTVETPRCIDRSTLSNMIHRWARLAPVNQQALEHAQRESASARVDKGLHAVETAPLDKDAIQKARVIADVGFRYAGLVDRERWGETKQAVNVQVNVEAMYLDALRHRTVQLPSTSAASPRQIEEGRGVGACETDSDKTVAVTVSRQSAA